MKYLAFDDIVRNLLVYLKGQVPSLSAKDSREDVLKQIQSMTFTLRSTIVQLEGAAFHDPRNTEDYQNLEKELQAIKQTNAKLEESLFLEMNKTQELREKAAENAKALELEKSENAKLEKLISSLKEEIEKLQNSPAAKIEVPIADESALEALKNEIVELETALSKAESINQQMRQTLQNKEVELSKSKDALMDAMKLDKSEISDLKSQLISTEQLKTENATLKKKIAELERDLAVLPSSEVFRNNIAAADAKIKFLEAALANAQEDLKNLRGNMASTTPEAVLREKEQLEQRVLDLEATLKSVIKTRDTSSGRSGDKFVFTPEECVFLFETLSTTTSRLVNSLENRDVYMRSKESIGILEKSNAIQKVYTVGQIFDGKIHKAAKSFKSDFLPDGIIIHEETPGFVSGTRLIQKALVWVAKSLFTCGECNSSCRPHEYFCPRCGLELTAPDGTSKRELPAYPAKIEVNLPLLDELIKQGNLKAAVALANLISRENPGHPELLKRQALLQKAERPIDPAGEA
ncbi:MAG TPA: nucleotide exchange factor GrpE [Candidatus Rifleibacterium sp.]|nr:nucleotide exchange factor GrpE [Candidatus Rifleibacterium sp.]HPW58803.1 nucleotide exchange factor GrpE [Candidatus Rifleibacterium sp.]